MDDVSDLASPRAGLRRKLPALLLLLCLLGIGATAQTAQAGDGEPLRGKHIVFVEPDGPNSVTNLPVAIMQAAL